MLVELGLELMNGTNTKKDQTPFRRALDYRDGLMIALLAATLLRRRNMVELELDRTLVRCGPTWNIVIPAHESKTGRLIEMPVSKFLAPYLETFIKIYRPLFRLSDIHSRLWPSRNGKPLSESQFFNAITTRTKKSFGHSINPHLFRDCAVTSIARHHGSEIGVGSALLGHRHPRVTEKYYNQAGMIDAVRGYQAILAAMDENLTKET